MGADPLVQDSQLLAEQCLRDVQTRLDHVAAVAGRLRRVAFALREQWAPQLVAAGWLHDVGYAPSVRQTGCHALDGARFLAANGYPALVCQLVGYHSGAAYEAAARGMSTELAELPVPDTSVLDLMTWADMTTSPTGATVPLTTRVAEILTRYSENDPVHQAITAARPALAGAVQRVEGRLGKLVTS